jgi:inorganic triphosphatase YgiF
LKRVLLAMPAVKSEVRLKVVSMYYDTPTLALNRERLSFRVRKQGSEFVQTLKAENPAQADILARKEWEDQIPSKRPVLNAPKTGKRLPDTVRDEELHPVFTTTVTRTVIEISPESSARIEVALDKGEIRTSKRRCRRANQRNRARAQEGRSAGDLRRGAATARSCANPH